MCGRFTLKTPATVLKEMFGVSELPGFRARYNIAPTQEAATVRIHDGAAEWLPMRWGLIPVWARDPTIGNRLINARAETLTEKPAFREAFAQRRCLVPADGFYEWERIANGRKQPWHLSLADDRPFAFAGLWERWHAPSGWLLSFSIVTTEPNSVIAPIHDRMPAILLPESFDRWLDGTAVAKDLAPLLRPVDPELMRSRAVSALVNSPANDDPRCLEPVAAVRPGNLFD
jgi:putative SOS response-associated peptidase YedK